MVRRPDFTLCRMVETLLAFGYPWSVIQKMTPDVGLAIMKHEIILKW